MSFTFAIIWIIFWGWVFNITNAPSGWQIFWFIFIGIGGPVGTILLKRS